MLLLKRVSLNPAFQAVLMWSFRASLAVSSFIQVAALLCALGRQVVKEVVIVKEVVKEVPVDVVREVSVQCYLSIRLRNGDSPFSFGLEKDCVGPA